MKKVWIVGASGHVGTALCSLLDCTEYEIFATDVTDVDVTDLDSVHAFARMNRPDVVINCSGITDKKACEEDIDKAYHVNAIGPRNLAVECQIIAAKLIHISTDDVFDAITDHPYNEFDLVHPKNVYGKSKAAGERLITSITSRYVIVRSSWVYGTGRDFLNIVLDAVRDKKDIEVAVNQISSPTSAIELARVIMHFIDNDCWGIYHAVSKGACTRYEYAKEILKCLGKEDAIKIIPIGMDKEIEYTVLDNMMLRLDGIEEPQEWKKALADYIKTTGGNQ